MPLRRNKAIVKLFRSRKLGLQPAGLRPLVADWSAAGPFLLDRLRQEAVAHPNLDELVVRLERLAPDAATGPRIDERDVVPPLRLIVAERELWPFSILAGFGSALDAHMADLRIEYFSPEVEPTRFWFEGVEQSAV